MMAPNDVQNKRFEKAMSGYRVEEVNSFLADVAAHIDVLNEDRADLQHKLEILAEKVEQYREDEDSLRAALIGAQKLGDSVVRDAKRKAEAIIAQAARTAEEMVGSAQTNIDREVDALNRMQKEVAKFKGQILQLYKQHIELIQSIPEEDELPELKKTDMQLAADIGSTVEITPAEESADANADKPAPEADFGPGKKNEETQLVFEHSIDETDETGVEEETSDAFPKRDYSRFGKLRFGEAYDLARKD